MGLLEVVCRVCELELVSGFSTTHSGFQPILCSVGRCFSVAGDVFHLTVVGTDILYFNSSQLFAFPLLMSFSFSEFFFHLLASTLT